MGQEQLPPIYVYVGAFVDELVRAGVQHAVICPGSRSTPLALTLAAQPDMQYWVHVDERSAAFFALGLAKYLDSPVALVCTSGTAAANFFPAIVEAKLAHVPLLVITADRPPELFDSGAPQTIDQQHLYGRYVKWFANTALPEATDSALRYIRTLAHRAVTLAQVRPAGPVHLNMPFREPLTPDPVPDGIQVALSVRETPAWSGRREQEPYVKIRQAEPGLLAVSEIARLAGYIRQYERGLIIVGPQQQRHLSRPLQELAHAIGYPILADPLSGLRTSTHLKDDTPIITSYDAFLRLPAFIQSYQPDFIIRFGAFPTSKPLQLYLQQHKGPQVVVNDMGSWEDAAHVVSDYLFVDGVALARQLKQALLVDEAVQARHEERRAWAQNWSRAETLARQVLRDAIEAFSDLFEGRVFSELETVLPEESILYVGNSMPVRDLDTFFQGTEYPLTVLGNRGANGIDGLVSSAFGVSAAVHETAKPVVLVIGDLSFYHDLNGLLAAHSHHLSLTIILVNNNGGGIFSFLPQAAYPTHFEQLFGTPLNLDFQHIVQTYGGSFVSIADWEQFRRETRKGISEPGLHVIEVRTERTSNVQQHRLLWQKVQQAFFEQNIVDATSLT